MPVVTYEAALAARRTAGEKVADLRAKRDAAKEDYLDVYAATAAHKVSDAVVADDSSDDGSDDDAPAGGGDAAPVPPTPA